ncbi:MAG: imidazole glycerol phosphate synthase subunit HisH [Steroidobacteraceae bacterium]
MAEVSILDYGIGNVGSILNMLRKLRVPAQTVSDRDSVRTATRLILPGIGAFDACVSALEASGLRDDVLAYAAGGRPLLGICVGMQMLTLGSEEGVRPGLGLIRAETRRFEAAAGLRIPHMGWDSVRWAQPGHALSRNLLDQNRFYFVHSYRVICESPAESLAVCSYGGEFSAAIANRNVAGVQFHPEKSHRFGLQLLGNFASA